MLSLCKETITSIRALMRGDSHSFNQNQLKFLTFYFLNTMLNSTTAAFTLWSDMTQYAPLDCPLSCPATLHALIWISLHP